VGDLYISTGAFQTRDLGEILACCVVQGIESLELGSGLPYAEHHLALVRQYHQRPMRYLIHNYFPPPQRPFVLNLASTDPETLTRSRDHARRAIDLATELSVPCYSVHAGSAMHAAPEDLGRPLSHRAHPDVQRAYALFVESLSALAAYGASRGVRLLVENHVVAPFNLVDGRNTFLFASTAEQILALMRDVASPTLGMLVDVGHVNVTAQSLGFDRDRFIERIAPHVEAFHLSDNDGTVDDNMPFTREVWFLKWLREFPQATITIESYHLELEQIRACREAVLEHVA
jgi:sugar phosphate isomerase/epimerase